MPKATKTKTQSKANVTEEAQPKRRWKFNKVDSHLYELEINLDDNPNAEILFTADHHWDNAHSRLDLLKRDMDAAVAKDIPIFCFGDLFCAMQGKWDKRADQEQLRPEHRGNNYLDKLVNTAVDWYAPYGKNLAMVTEGNHECLREGALIKTRAGYEPIESITTDTEVASIDSDGVLRYSKPTHYHRYDNVPTLVKFSGNNIRHEVTEDHDVIYGGVKIKAKHLVGQRMIGSEFTRSWQDPEATDAPIDADFLRLVTWTVMDGTIVRGEKGIGNKCRVQFKLSLQHKIDELSTLLDRMGVPYSLKPCKKYGVNKLQPYYIRFYSDWARRVAAFVGEEKVLPESIVRQPVQSLEVFLETLRQTDGAEKDGVIEWRTTSKTMAYRVMDWLAACGRGESVSSKLSGNASGFDNGNPQYHIRIRTSPRHHQGAYTKAEIVPYGGSVYCVTTKYGNIITSQDGGCPMLTGNSSITQRHQTDLLDRFAGGIRANGGLTEKGPYWGFIVVRLTYMGRSAVKIINFHHGYGGGGEVTRGLIDNSRTGRQYMADVYVSGHVHWRNDDENVITEVCVQGKKPVIRTRDQLYLRCSSYKEDHGWHQTKGRAARPIGGWLYKMRRARDGENHVIHHNAERTW